jgi:hypothetical protein
VTTPWTSGSEPASNSCLGGAVTLLDGTTFCLSEPGGDIQPSGTQGLFARDTRVLSRWTLTFDGVTPAVLDVQRVGPYHARFLGRIPPAARLGDSKMLVVRSRHLGEGMREQITLRNLAIADVEGVLRLCIARTSPICSR